MSRPQAPRLVHLMTIDIDGSAPLELGETPLGRRRIVPVTGGSFDGKIRGDVLPAGGDWALVRRDGSFVPDVRLVLRTDDGVLVSFQYTGRWTAEPEAMARLLRREGDLASIPFYWRASCQFECASGSSVDWLNGIVAISTGRPKAGGAIYDVYQVT